MKLFEIMQESSWVDRGILKPLNNEYFLFIANRDGQHHIAIYHGPTLKKIWYDNVVNVESCGITLEYNGFFDIECRDGVMSYLRTEHRTTRECQYELPQESNQQKKFDPFWGDDFKAFIESGQLQKIESDTRNKYIHGNDNNDLFSRTVKLQPNVIAFLVNGKIYLLDISAFRKTLEHHIDGAFEANLRQELSILAEKKSQLNRNITFFKQKIKYDEDALQDLDEVERQINKNFY